jgi:CRP-like cAMP-binding protein
MTGSQTGKVGAEASTTLANCIGYLSGSSLGAELTPEELATLASKVKLLSFAKNQVLISEGDLDDQLYAIAHGIFSVSRRGERGDERLSMLGPGAITGELAFLDGLKRTATVRAEKDDSYVIAICRDELEYLIPDHPLIVYKVMRAVIRSAHTTVGKMDATYAELMHYISG